MIKQVQGDDIIQPIHRPEPKIEGIIHYALRNNAPRHPTTLVLNKKVPLVNSQEYSTTFQFLLL